MNCRRSGSVTRLTRHYRALLAGDVRRRHKSTWPRHRSARLPLQSLGLDRCPPQGRGLPLSSLARTLTAHRRSGMEPEVRIAKIICRNKRIGQAVDRAERVGLTRLANPVSLAYPAYRPNRPKADTIKSGSRRMAMPLVITESIASTNMPRRCSKMTSSVSP